MVTLKIIIGSTRPGRVGLPVGKWFYEIAKTNKELRVELVDLKEINLPFFDEPNHPSLRQYTKHHTKEWSTIIESADAFVFVTPEYNYGFPATIKNALDYLSMEWRYKPVGFVSYGGIAGGTRAVQLLKPIVAALGMVAIQESVNIPFVKEYLDDEGNFLGNERFEKTAQEMVHKLAVWAKYLIQIRQELLPPQQSTKR